MATGPVLERKPTAEPFVWLLFSGGGVIAALTLPVLLVLFGLAFPLGWLTPPEHADLAGLLRNPLVRFGLLAICVLSLVHAAHRLRYTLRDGLQLQRYDLAVATVCYGGALAGSAAATYLLLVLL
jgi:fumarate reductase subunit D